MQTSMSVPVFKAAPARARLDYIDTIRVILTVLVVMVHAGVTYGSIGGWFYVEQGSDDVTKAVLSLFVTLCQGFFMGLFFFISGMFIPGSYDRKGFAAFWKDRLLRLGLPFLTFSFILAKYPIYTYMTRYAGYTGSLWEYTRDNFFTALDAGPTWFLFALLVLAGAYSLYRLARGKAAPLFAGLKAPGLGGLLGFALLMAVLTLLAAQISPIGVFKPLFGFIYLQGAFFPQYLLMFAGGILAGRGDWLAAWGKKNLRAWIGIAVACVLLLPALFVGGGAAEGKFDAFMTGFTWQATCLSLWAGLTCVSFSMVLLLGLRGTRAHPSLGASAYAAYLVHPVVLVAITRTLSPVPLAPILKFALASVLAASASFGLGWLLKKIPGVEKVL